MQAALDEAFGAGQTKVVSTYDSSNYLQTQIYGPGLDQLGDSFHMINGNSDVPVSVGNNGKEAYIYDGNLFEGTNYLLTSTGHQITLEINEATFKVCFDCSGSK